MSALITPITQYAALEEMGISRFSEISHYSLKSDGASKDILKVYYKRAKGSLLPYSRKYKFGRSLKTVIADGGTARMEHTYEISPFLLKAVSELDSLVKSATPSNTADVQSVSQEKAQLIAELESLEMMVTASVSEAEAATIAARFARFKAQLEAL